MYENLTRKITQELNILRSVTMQEEKYVAKWKEKFRFRDDIVLEAAKRTYKRLQDKSSFAYMDGILSNWYKNNLKNHYDIIEFEQNYKKTGKTENSTEKNENKDAEKILIKYHNDKLEKLRYVDGQTDWVDLRAAEDVSLKKGETALISLGISVKLPEGYEMIIAPRASTYKNFGIIQTNSIGIISEKDYGDILKMPVKAERDTEIHINNRICQFRIIKHQPALIFEEVEHLEERSRGGFGNTGKGNNNET